MINRQYFIWYIFIFNIINKIYFENIRYVKNYEVVIRKKKNIERGIGNDFAFIRRYYKNRLLSDVSYKNRIKGKNRVDKEGDVKRYDNNNDNNNNNNNNNNNDNNNDNKMDNSYNYKNKSIKENKTKIRKEQVPSLDKTYNRNINEKEEIKKKIKDIQRKRLIIHFKQDNTILSSRNYKHIFMKVLSNCGHIEKLTFINFYLYEFPKSINNEDMLLKFCLRLLESRRINVENDYQISHTKQMKSHNKNDDSKNDDNKNNDSKNNDNKNDDSKNNDSKNNDSKNNDSTNNDSTNNDNKCDNMNSKNNCIYQIKDKIKDLPNVSPSASTFNSISTSPYTLKVRDRNKYPNDKNYIFKINHSNKNNNNNNYNYHHNNNQSHSSAKYQTQRLNKKMIGTNILDGYDIIQMEEGLNLSHNYELNDVNVCIIDTGIDENHIDLKDNIIEKKTFMKHSDKKYNIDGINSIESSANIESSDNIESINNIESSDNINSINNIDSSDNINSINNIESSDNINSINNIESSDNNVHTMLRNKLYLEKKKECCNYNTSNDGHGHGTFIAGIIAGNSPKGKKGIKGISKKAKLIICKALNNNNAGYISDILECFNFCAKKKARIINASFASTTHYPSLFQALKELQDKDILVISSSGNCSSNSKCKQAFQECNLNIQKLYPAAYSADLRNIISVSNIIQQSNGNIVLSPDSCYSPNYVHLAAPGGNIISAFPNNKYAISSGTSFSAAVITGLASLVLSINSNLTSQQVIELFKKSIVQTKSLENKVKWGGFINVYDLVRLTIDSLPKDKDE
ncbi:subtilisin-like protease 3, putative [Plasmodium reichenowi]|uniref:subtilisin n=1 Tax=Plasmodium reichenowi TaxID=5854 RepID=A0A060RPA5_PLARE|nr:subtilisin-like protease 3, putative [Plasmodium reichenowi]